MNCLTDWSPEDPAPPTQTSSETWEVEAGGQTFSTSFDELQSWIADGSVLRMDRVRRGNLRWIEAGKVPALIEFFNAKEATEPPAPAITATTTEILGVSLAVDRA